MFCVPREGLLAFADGEAHTVRWMRPDPRLATALKRTARGMHARRLAEELDAARARRGRGSGARAGRALVLLLRRRWARGAVAAPAASS